MIQGTNNSVWDLFPSLSSIRSGFTSISDSLVSLFNPKPVTQLENPDTLFLSTPKKEQNYNDFSFYNYSFLDKPLTLKSPVLDNTLTTNNPVLDKSIVGRNKYLATEKLKTVTPKELADLGKNNKTEFFRTLLPAALEAERIYGVPASVTLAQAALESGWGKYPIGGYNIFGIKGKGPAGTVNVKTKEWIKGKYVSITDNFAKYNNFYEAVMKHGQVFQSKYKGYQKGLEQWSVNHNDVQFIDNVGSTYATSPTYKNDIKKIMKDFDLVNMAKNYYIH